MDGETAGSLTQILHNLRSAGGSVLCVAQQGQRGEAAWTQLWQPLSLCAFCLENFLKTVIRQETGGGGRGGRKEEEEEEGVPSRSPFLFPCKCLEAGWRGRSRRKCGSTPADVKRHSCSMFGIKNCSGKLSFNDVSSQNTQLIAEIKRKFHSGYLPFSLTYGCFKGKWEKHKHGDRMHF